MASTDSVSIFAEGTFEEQIQELVNYVVRNQPDEDRAAFIKPFQETMKTTDGQQSLENDPDRRRKIFTMVSSQIKGLGEGSEKEIEGFFNLLYSHLFTLYSADSPEIQEHLTALLQIISSSPSQQSATRYRILSNLFNATPRKSALRLPVYNALLQVATANNQLDILGLSIEDVEKWLAEWSITSEDKSAFLKSIVDAYTNADQPLISYQYKLFYVRSLGPASDAGKTAAVDAIATALRLPTVFDFDPLLKLDAVVAAKDSELFSLLQIFLNEGLPEFNAWEGSHAGVLEQHQLDKAQLERKIRLLTLASLGFQHIGQDLPYATIASALQIDATEVEKWVIDVIRVGLLSGKLSQNTQTLHVIRSAARTFEHDQWQALEKRLVAWKAGLAAVLEVVASARGTSTGSVKQEVVTA
ncbi:PCI-domain-containing protein [Athelia psychrophila]|uniref:Eukaryotic translation initiation factor 3 subunit M n=1 Tax=Athelia psychrophila TaxID=1759441 RepID=A0A167X1P3_9AGAM|nr:PCI-domain-containing protein [Fibularhizoctonia sp. CBS 109695]